MLWSLQKSNDINNFTKKSDCVYQSTEFDASI